MVVTLAIQVPDDVGAAGGVGATMCAAGKVIETEEDVSVFPLGGFAGVLNCISPPKPTTNAAAPANFILSLCSTRFRAKVRLVVSAGDICSGGGGAATNCGKLDVLARASVSASVVL